ncbi:MAG: hypothetical protein AAF610_02705 [Pseudomonadota bacterium]
MLRKTLMLAGLGLIATAAHAGDYGKWFDKMDADADGYLTAAELGEKKAYKIQKMDTDGDGQISRDELFAYKAAKKRKKDDTA